MPSHFHTPTTPRAVRCAGQLLQSIRCSDVAVVCGDTGCGKTTQIGQYILEDAIESGSGSGCHVVCTQPRRVAAVSGECVAAFSFDI